MLTFLPRLFVGLCLVSSVLMCSAQDAWPSKPIKIIVPVAPGGNVDIVARTLAKELTKGLGQPVLVENRPSASSLLGTQLVAKSNPDGYTLLAHSSTFFTAPLILSNAGYDPIKDFAPVSLTCKAAMVLVTGAQQPIQSVADVIQQAKARPEGLTVASSGNGSTGHIASEVFSNRAGIRMLNIFYKGNAQSVVDVISGQTQLMFDQISTSLSHIRSEKIRPIAVTSLNRSLLLPGIPSIAESGFPGYEDVTINMLLAPAGTPKEIVQRLHAEIVKSYAQAELVGSFAERGIELVASASPEDFGLLIKSEVARLTKVSRSAGIKAE